MWCIPTVNEEFVKRMENILDLYEKPYDPEEPVLCFDEKNTQLLEDIRSPIAIKEGKERKCDYEYKRNGTANIFVTVESKAGFRSTKVTKRRTKRDFAIEIKRVVRLKRYRDVRRIHIVLDNLNTHFEKSLIETFGKEETMAIMCRITFHYTPKHASWLNMAEIEIGILSRQCLKQRISSYKKLRMHIQSWQKPRNRHKSTIKWRWTKKDARKVFKIEGVGN